MAKDKSGKSDVTRIDLRIPNHIFEEIEKLAIETNQPLHHISGKVITTPVILNLINLGLESVRKEDFGIESIASKDSLREAEIEKKILNTLTQKLEGIVSDKLTDIIENKVKEAINSLTDNLTEQLTDSKDISKEIEVKEDVTAFDSGGNDSNYILPDNLTDNLTINSDLEIEDNETNSEKIDPPEDTETITSEIVNEPISAPPINSELNENIEAINEDVTPKNTEDKESIEGNSEVKTFDEAVIEIKRLKKQGLGNTAIAKNLTGKFYTKQGKVNWSDTQVRRLLNPSQK